MDYDPLAVSLKRSMKLAAIAVGAGAAAPAAEDSGTLQSGPVGCAARDGDRAGVLGAPLFASANRPWKIWLSCRFRIGTAAAYALVMPAVSGTTGTGVVRGWAAASGTVAMIPGGGLIDNGAVVGAGLFAACITEAAGKTGRDRATS